MPVAFASGVLIDVDHVLEYYRWHFRRDRRFFLVALHGWEYSLVGLALALTAYYHPLALAAAVSHLAHMAVDTVTNPVHRLAYSLAYRVLRRFDRQALMNEPVRTLSQSLNRFIPFWGPVEPLLMRWPPYRSAAHVRDADL